jgi:hypothetical protein
MQIRRKWLNQLENFLTNIFENIIWHLFAGESHQVVKITVPYYGVVGPLCVSFLDSATKEQKCHCP